MVIRVNLRSVDRPLTVLVNAGPWLPVPPPGYGGIENVVATLVHELRRRGVRVLLASVGASDLDVDELITAFPDGQFARLQQPYNRVMGVAAAHLHQVVARLRRPGAEPVDLVHDHQEAFGLAVFDALGEAAPPALHTLHWDLTKHPELYGDLDPGGRVRVNGVSAAQVATAPAALRALSVGAVHLATPLAVGADRRPPVRKRDHLLVLGRITPYKGQHVAARVAHRTGRDLVLAGPVGPCHHPDALPDADPANPDVRYYREQVEPLVDGRRVRWIGTVAGPARDDLLASAVASLTPIDWEEPGGTAVVESLALGTPVIGFRRGCLPELVDHDRTGLLVDPGDEDAMAAAVRVAHTLDPDTCRREAARRFTPARMAGEYLRLYHRVLEETGRARWGRREVGGVG